MSPWQLGSVEIGVADLPRSIEFYAGVLGLELVEQSAEGARLGAGDRVFLALTALPGAMRDPAMAGLFHTAWLYPDRASLGQAIERVEGAGLSLTGAADHLVSEAVYLDDPDGHGVELYRDRPEADWPRQNGRLRMANEPIDRAGIIQAARQSTRPFEAARRDLKLGHVHLESCDLDGDERILTGELGLDRTVAWPQARFLAWNGYHHHLAVNNWGRRRKPVEVGAERIGLRRLDVFGPRAAELTTASGLTVVVHASGDQSGQG